MVRIATVVASRSDLWPVGTTVGVYPMGAVHAGGGETVPRAVAISTGVVDASGNLSIAHASILAGTTYTLHATVNGEQHACRVRSTADIQDLGRVVGTGDTVSGSSTILNASASSGSFQIGQRISGPGIRAGTLINNIVTTTLAIDQPASATANTVAIQGESGKSWVARVKTRKAAIGTT